jgi:hypothetical protein
MTPITIGDQKFVKDENKGWIDSKTKQPADKGLIRLLDSLVIDEPVLKKLRTKIDKRVEPVSINGQKFVYDVNHGWVDEKTKTPVPPSLQRTLSNAVPRFGNNSDIDLTAGFGIVGQAAQQQTKAKAKPNSGGGVLPSPSDNVSIKEPIIKMINALASIDGFLKQRLINQKIIAKNNLLTTRESQIENIGQPAQEVRIVQQDAEKVEGPSAGGLLAVGGLVALLTLDPVQEALKSVVDGVVNAGKFLTDTVSSINSVFTFLLGSNATDPTAVDSLPESKPNAPAASTPDAQPMATEEASTTSSPSAVPAAAASVAVPSITPSSTPMPVAIGGATTPVSTGSSPSSTSMPIVTGRSTTPVSSSTSSSTPMPVATGGSTTPVSSSIPSSPQSKPAAFGSAEYFTANVGGTGEIPKNDIVALGNYLIGQGADRSKMEHPALSGKVGKHSKNSRHYRNMAIDVNFPENEAARLDALKPQLEAAGYNVLWRTEGHRGHMHVSLGGREGGNSRSYGDSMMGVVSDTVNLGAEKIGELFGMLGSAIIKPGVPRDKEDYSKAITAAAVQTNAEVAVTKTPKSSPVPGLPTPSNINKTNGGTTPNSATSADKNSVYYYLRRFGFQDLNTPEKALAR